MPVDKSSDRVRQMFGRIAGRYDFLNHLLSLGIDHYWRWRTVRLVAPTGPLPILDVCTGTGDLALAYDRAAGRQTQIIAGDFCPEMLEIGRQKAAKIGADPRIEFIEADAQALPVASEAFQIVCVAFGLRNVADTDRGLAEMTRAVPPAAASPSSNSPRPPGNPSKRSTAGTFATSCRASANFSRDAGDAYEYLPTSVGEFPQGEALAERMRAAGLNEVRRYPLTLGVATLYVGKRLKALVIRLLYRSGAPLLATSTVTLQQPCAIGDRSNLTPNA